MYLCGFSAQTFSGQSRRIFPWPKSDMRHRVSFDSSSAQMSSARGFEIEASSWLVVALPRGLIEISQIRGLLGLSDRHQQAISAQKVIVVADHDMLIGRCTNILVPIRIGVAPIGPRDRPGTS